MTPLLAARGDSASANAREMSRPLRTRLQSCQRRRDRARRRRAAAMGSALMRESPRAYKAFCAAVLPAVRIVGQFRTLWAHAGPLVRGRPRAAIHGLAADADRGGQ